MSQRNKKASFQGWNTPPDFVEVLRGFRPISLDPCSNPHSMVGAEVALEWPEYDGLQGPWHLYDHTFVNPPYDNQPAWISKASDESALGAPHITMLIPSSTETKAFQGLVFGSCDAICFLDRRLKFWRDGVCPPKGGNTLPSAVPYWGIDPKGFAEAFAPHGTTVTDWHGKAHR